MSEAIDKTTNTKEEAQNSFSFLAEQITNKSEKGENDCDVNGQHQDEDGYSDICIDCLMNEHANSSLLARIMKTQLDAYEQYKNCDVDNFALFIQEDVRNMIYGDNTGPAKG